MTTVDEIRAYLASLPADYKYLSDGGVRTATWLRTLLTENAKMAAVVEAAREWRDVTAPETCTMDEAVYVCDRLLGALAALEGGE